MVPVLEMPVTLKLIVPPLLNTPTEPMSRTDTPVTLTTLPALSIVAAGQSTCTPAPDELLTNPVPVMVMLPPSELMGPGTLVAMIWLLGLHGSARASLDGSEMAASASMEAIPSSVARILRHIGATDLG